MACGKVIMGARVIANTFPVRHAQGQRKPASRRRGKQAAPKKSRAAAAAAAVTGTNVAFKCCVCCRLQTARVAFYSRFIAPHHCQRTPHCITSATDGYRQRVPDIAETHPHRGLMRGAGVERRGKKNEKTRNQFTYQGLVVK